MTPAGIRAWMVRKESQALTVGVHGVHANRFFVCAREAHGERDAAFFTPSSRYAGERAGERGEVRVESSTVRFAASRRPTRLATKDVECRSPLSPEYREE